MSTIKVDTIATRTGSGNITVSNNIAGGGTISGTNITASGTLGVTGNTTVGGTLGVTGATTFTGAVSGTTMTLLNTTTVSSAVASVSFDSSLITDAYMDYMVKIRFAAPATNGQALYVFASANNGSNYNILIEQAKYYHDLKGSNANGNASTAGNSAYKIDLNAGIENTANKGTNVDINFLSLRNTTGYKMMYYNSVGTHDLDGGHNTGNDYWWHGAAKIIGTSNSDRTAINNLKFQFASGNVAQGTFSLYGIKS